MFEPLVIVVRQSGSSSSTVAALAAAGVKAISLDVGRVEFIYSSTAASRLLSRPRLILCSRNAVLGLSRLAATSLAPGNLAANTPTPSPTPFTINSLSNTPRFIPFSPLFPPPLSDLAYIVGQQTAVIAAQHNLAARYIIFKNAAALLNYFRGHGDQPGPCYRLQHKDNHNSHCPYLAADTADKPLPPDRAAAYLHCHGEPFTLDFGTILPAHGFYNVDSACLYRMVFAEQSGIIDLIKSQQEAMSTGQPLYIMLYSGTAAALIARDIANYTTILLRKNSQHSTESENGTGATTPSNSSSTAAYTVVVNSTLGCVTPTPAADSALDHARLFARRLHYICLSQRIATILQHHFALELSAQLAPESPLSHSAPTLHRADLDRFIPATRQVTISDEPTNDAMLAQLQRLIHLHRPSA